MTNTAHRSLFHHFWKATLLSGVLTAVLGVLILVWPGKSLTVAAVLFGVYLLVSGVAQVIFAFTLPVTAGARILLFISGAASVVLAVLAFRHFDYGYAYLLLAIWIAVGFIFRGAATAADYSGSFGAREAGIAILDWPANLNSPSPWYVISENPMHYFSPAVICYQPHTLKAGHEMTLRYRVIVHPGRWNAEQLGEASKRYMAAAP